jgi:hypothetical protein
MAPAPLRIPETSICAKFECRHYGNGLKGATSYLLKGAPKQTESSAITRQSFSDDSITHSRRRGIVVST